MLRSTIIKLKIIKFDYKICDYKIRTKFKKNTIIFYSNEIIEYSILYFLSIFFRYFFFFFSCIKKQTHQFDKTSFNLKSDNWFQEHPIHRSISRKLIRSPSVFSSERDEAKMLQTVGRWLEEAYQNRIGFQRRKYHRLKSLREEKQKVSYFVHYFYIINYLHGWNKKNI